MPTGPINRSPTVRRPSVDTGATAQPAQNRRPPSPGSERTGPGVFDSPTPGLNLAPRRRTQAVQQKSVPYVATSLVPNVRIMLNGSVAVRPTAQEPPQSAQAVVCRHLATAFVQHAGAKRDLMAAFSTAAGVEGRFDAKLVDTSAQFQRLLHDAGERSKHLVGSENLGRYLESLAQALPAPGENGPSEANSLLLTNQHAMALHVQRKRKDGVEYFSAKLFDPNSTAAYKRVEALHPQDLQRLTLKDMFVAGWPNAYCLPNQSAVSMVAVCLNERLRLPPTAGGPIPTTAENMHSALRMGMVGPIRLMLSDLASRQSMPQAELFNLLQAKLEGHHQSGLHLALAWGHGAKTAAAFVNAVAALEALPIELRLELLAGKRSDGVPGLYVALQEGLPVTVKAYVQAVTAAKTLSHGQQAELLAAKKANGTPGLLIALKNGHTGTVNAYVEAVNAAQDLPRGLREELVLLPTKFQHR